MWGVAFCILIFSFVDAIVGVGAGIGTGIAVLDVSIEPDREGTPMVDSKRGSKQFLAFLFDFASSCAFMNPNLTVSGVSVFSLDSVGRESVGGDGRYCGRERDGEGAGVEGTLER